MEFEIECDVPEIVAVRDGENHTERYRLSLSLSLFLLLSLSLSLSVSGCVCLGLCGNSDKKEKRKGETE